MHAPASQIYATSRAGQDDETETQLEQLIDEQVELEKKVEEQKAEAKRKAEEAAKLER